MKFLTLTLVTIIILSGNIVNLHSADFWVKYHSMTDEMIDVTAYDSYYPVYLTNNNKIYFGNNSELNIPEPDPIYNSIFAYNGRYTGNSGFGFFVGTNNLGIFRYNHSSKTWQAFNTNLTDTNMTILYATDELVFAKSSDNKLWKSGLENCNWELMDAGLDGININSIFYRGFYRIVMNKYKYVAGTDGHGTFGWNEDLLKWEPFNIGIENDTIIGTYIANNYQNQYFTQIGSFWAATKNGMFKLENVEGTELYKWTAYNQGLENLRITSLSGLENR